jgi:hypothetical protein
MTLKIGINVHKTECSGQTPNPPPETDFSLGFYSYEIKD